VGAGEADCAFAEIAGKNVTSNTATSRRGGQQQALRTVFLAETGVGRAFDPQQFIVISEQQ
jgi:hypothetical protein